MILATRQSSKKVQVPVVKFLVWSLSRRSVIAVHGLARGFKSWSWGESSLKRSNWLEAGLAREEDCGRKTRIMTYSYEPDLFKSQAHVRTVLYGRAHDLVHKIARLRKQDGTSKRPLIFIAHSLGGLIVKRALIFSTESSDADLRGVEIATGGVVYFGTPDDDTQPKSLAETIFKISLLSAGSDGWMTGDKKPLLSDAAWLKSELESYKPICSEIKVLSVYETKTTSFARGQPAFVSYPHSTVCAEAYTP
jgi:hypothetical protein